MPNQESRQVSFHPERNAFDRHVVNAACHLLMVGLWLEAQARGIKAARTTPNSETRVHLQARGF
jgi:hypothetical protein